MNFDQALVRLLAHEGGFSDNKSDPGGKTLYGITENVARDYGYLGAMNELPLSIAKRIYRNKYWDAIMAEQMPDVVRYPLFDAAVNSGVAQSVKWLQGALGVEADGIIGPVTLEAVRKANTDSIARVMIGKRLRFMAGLPGWGVFSRGWARRIADILETQT